MPSPAYLVPSSCREGSKRAFLLTAFCWAVLPFKQNMATYCCEHPGKMPGAPLLLSSSLQVLLAVILQDIPIRTRIFLICSEMSSFLQDEMSKGFLSFFSTAVLSHSATVESKNQDYETCVQRTDNLFAIRCESIPQKFALTILMFSSNKLLSDPFFFYFIYIFKSSRTNVGINSIHQKIFSLLT